MTDFFFALLEVSIIKSEAASSIAINEVNVYSNRRENGNINFICNENVSLSHIPLEKRTKNLIFHFP